MTWKQKLVWPTVTASWNTSYFYVLQPPSCVQVCPPSQSKQKRVSAPLWTPIFTQKGPVWCFVFEVMMVNWRSGKKTVDGLLALKQLATVQPHGFHLIKTTLITSQKRTLMTFVTWRKTSGTWLLFRCDWFVPHWLLTVCQTDPCDMLSCHMLIRWGNHSHLHSDYAFRSN